MKISMDFEWTFDAFWRSKLMIWEAKMPLKIIKKINEILNAFLYGFWNANCKKNFIEFCPGDSPHGARNSEFA